MGIYCSNNILAFGPEEQLVQIRQLIEECTRIEEGAIQTYFDEIFGTDVGTSVGTRWHSEEEGCVWLGECNPPMGFVHQMSVRFPQVTFEMRTDAEDVDYLEIHEFRRGISVRRIHKWGPGDDSITPSNFDAVIEMRHRLLHCVVEHLNEPAIDKAKEALGDLIRNGPCSAVELLVPLFERSECWPEFIAMEALGIDTNTDIEIAGLLERFDALIEA